MLHQIMANFSQLNAQHMVFFFFEIFGSTFIYTVHLEKRKQIWIRILFCTFILFGIMYGSSVFVIDVQNGNYWNQFLSLGIVYFLWLGFVWNICKIKIQEALFTVTCAYLTEHMLYCLRILIDVMIHRNLLVSGTTTYLVFNLIFYVFTYFFVARKLIDKNHYDVKILNSLRVTILTLFVVLVMSLFSTIYHFQDLHAIYAIICCGLVLESERKHIRELKLQEELNLNKQLWTNHESQYELAKETIEIINRKCHDLKHKIQEIGEMDDYAKRMDAVGEISKDVIIYSAFIHSGNEILDTILTEKSLICSEKKIELACMIDGKQLAFMETMDLYIIFGSALENAIENNLQIKNKQQRIISIQVFEKANRVFVQIENPMEKAYQAKEKDYLTGNRRKKSHVFTLQNVEEIVQKYEGVMTEEMIDNYFILRLMFQKSES